MEYVAGLINVMRYHACVTYIKYWNMAAQKMPCSGLHSVLAQLPFCFGAGLKDMQRKALSGASN